MKHTRAKMSASSEIGQITKLLDQIDPDLHAYTSAQPRSNSGLKK